MDQSRAASTIEQHHKQKPQIGIHRGKEREKPKSLLEERHDGRDEGNWKELDGKELEKMTGDRESKMEILH